MKNTHLSFFLVLFLVLSACTRLVTPQSTATSPLSGVLPTSAVSAERIEAAKVFVDQLTSGDFDAATATFDKDMMNVLGPGKLDETWTALVKQVGNFKQQTGIRSEQEPDYDVVYVVAEFESATLDIKVVFNKNSQISGLFFQPTESSQAYEPPDYVDTSSFSEQNVTVGSGEWALPGTLTLPEGDEPFAVVVLVHGSGPNDRDETIGPNKPFRDLAWGLASNGVAVLRYDKRTYTYTEKFTEEIVNNLTVQEETVDDAVAAVALLHQVAGFDEQRVFVLGHSLGGMLLPRIAKAAPDVAGLISLAGAARPMEDMVLDQITYLANLDGELTLEEQQSLDELVAQVALVKSPDLSLKTSASELPLGVSPAYWLDLRDYKPAQEAAKLPQPMLFLQGERDYQVTLDDWKLWQAALSSRTDVTFHLLYPSLNHLFMSGEGEPNPTEYSYPGHVAETVIDDILTWLQAQQ